MEVKMKKLILVVLLVFSVYAVLPTYGAAGQASKSGDLEESIIKALWNLPRYNVFDNLAFKIEDGNIVTLVGQVIFPILKKEAGDRVAKIPGVAKVVNSLEVLPLSENDDSVRIRAYRALFGTADLYRYAMGANPSIHIIVKGGHITLEGVVSTKNDAEVALLAVRGILGSFSAKSNLKIENPGK
jgi:hyperosmotically inducible protein